jgi:hypothetical protein
MADRDDFSEETKRKLCEQVNGLCSNPGCRVPTKGPHTDPQKSISIGMACHIYGASANGPRYDPNQTREQRRSIENGIWACSNCGTLIDADTSPFPASLLFEWKAEAQRTAFQAILNPRSSSPSPASAASVALALDYVTTERGQDLHRYELQAQVTNTSTKRIKDWYVEVDFPTLLLPPGVHFPARVEARSNPRRTLFRTSSKLDPLAAGDSFTFKLPYYVDNEILFNKTLDPIEVESVTARAFVDGEMVAETTRPMKELQNF